MLSLSQSQSQNEYQEKSGCGLTRRQKGKFDHLLKPNKNLAQSWGVDISKLLSEYAASLDLPPEWKNSALLSDVEEGLQVDFAEAALLLQGSTTIYCRKVEHLYSLVLAAVEIMNQMKSRKSKASGDGGDSDVEDGDDDDIWNLDEIDFLDLDDVFPTADSNKILRNEREHIESLRSASDPTKLVEVPPLLRVPTGAESDVSGKGALRMDLGIIDESGAMLLPGALESNCGLGEFQENANERTPSKRGSIPSPFDNQLDDDGNDFSPEILRQDASPQPPQAADDPFSPFAVNNMGEANNNEQQQAERKRTRDRKDPYKELDLHDDAGVRVRRCRAGRTADPSYRPRRGKRREKLDWLCAIDLCDLSEIGAIQQRKRRQVSFRGLLEPAKAMRRKIATVKRARYKGSRGEYLFADEAQHQLENDDMDDLGGGMDDNDDDDNGMFNNDDFGDEPNLGIRFEDDNDPNHLNMDIELPNADYLNENDSDMFRIAQGYQEACLSYVLKTSMLWEKKAENADLAERVEEWSARIRPKLEEEDKRPVYDIQASGTDVLQRVHRIETDIKSNDSVQHDDDVLVSMKSAFEAEEPFEVCRMFLATLQLANNYEVEISAGEDLNPNLKLLDSARVAEIRRPVLSEQKRSARDVNVPGSPVNLRPVKAIEKKPELRNSNRKRRREPSEVFTPGRNRIRARVSFLR